MPLLACSNVLAQRAGQAEDHARAAASYPTGDGLIFSLGRARVPACAVSVSSAGFSTPLARRVRPTCRSGDAKFEVGAWVHTQEPLGVHVARSSPFLTSMPATLNGVAAIVRQPQPPECGLCSDRGSGASSSAGCISAILLRLSGRAYGVPP